MVTDDRHFCAQLVSGRERVTGYEERAQFESQIFSRRKIELGLAAFQQRCHRPDTLNELTWLCGRRSPD